MSSTLDRLRELVRGTGAPRPAVAPAEDAPPFVPSSALRGLHDSTGPARGVRELTYEPVDRDGQPLPDPVGLPELFDRPSINGASTVDTPLGRCLVIDHRFAADGAHGRQAVQHGLVSTREVLDFCGSMSASSGGLSSADGSGSAGANNGGWPSADRGGSASAEGESTTIASSGTPAPLVFLDLETTGLSGGAGTVAFLVGCGFFEDGAFRTRQFLLPTFAAERALLHAVTSLIADAACLVTYNGRTFDVPVMETRWLFHRVAPPWIDLPHLDMLPLSRRLWRERDDVDGACCRLVTLERDLFGVVRHGDVPGFEIPGRYFEYIRGGNAALLEPVLHHNRLDLLSLAFLTARAMRLFREGPGVTRDPQECLALGRELWRRRDMARAVECFRAAAEAPTASGLVRSDALYEWARLLRRERRYVDAAAIWTRLVGCRGARPAWQAEAREALAVHYEHRDRDLTKAHEWASDAFDSESSGVRRDAVAHRLARLQRKIRVQAEGGPRTALLLDELF